MNQSGLLQFIFDEQGVHALWFPTIDKWLTIDLKAGELEVPSQTLAEALTSLPSDAPKSDVWLKPPSEDLVSLLNAEATRRSLEAVRKHQPPAIKTMLKPIQEKLSALIPSLKPAAQTRLLSLSDAYAGYLFLARHKVPAGETYIRKLLELPFEQKTTHTMFLEAPEFAVLSQERLLGDLAWRLWNEIKVDPNSARHRTAFPWILRKTASTSARCRDAFTASHGSSGYQAWGGLGVSDSRRSQARRLVEGARCRPALLSA